MKPLPLMNMNNIRTQELLDAMGVGIVVTVFFLIASVIFLAIWSLEPIMALITLFVFIFGTLAAYIIM
jgi:hypothetical protein